MSPRTTRYLVSCYLAVFAALCPYANAQQAKAAPVSLEQYLRASAVSKQVLDTFLDPNQLSWAKFDPELGYHLGNYFPRDGIDGSSTISTVHKTGARTAHVYVDRACRINTYGNSFTQCHQVSDGETWQEYLAAHLGEPVRNFGMGGHGVYQAYRRMMREEKGPRGGEYVILYIWGDDHFRSLLRCRHVLIYRWWDQAGGKLFHNNPWSHVEMDLERGRIVEKENLLPTPELLYRMTDPEWMYQNLKDDLAMQIALFSRGLTTDLDWPKVERLAAILRTDPIDRSTAEKEKEGLRRLLDKYSYAATEYILELARDFTSGAGKKLLVVLNDPRNYRSLVESGTRADQEIVDFLKQNNFLYFDMNLVHVEDYKKNYKIPFADYVKRYLMPHYNPAGNHFFAYSIKDTIVNWLVPKPVTYRENRDAMVEFTGYIE
ncbi:MAG: hypothetical protein ACE15E_11895 [Acidobacteriota bacterium]